MKYDSTDKQGSGLPAKSGISRKDFLKRSLIAAAGFTIVPSRVVSGLGHRAPSDRLNIAGVGVGGRGFGVLRGMEESENIVALCDVDWRYAAGCFEHYPNARRYWDWRKMLDEMGDSIDAVVVATSDHTHAAIAAHAMTLGKHVFVEKPLTHTVYESRLLTRLAEKYRVATQMGNQGASGEGTNQIMEWIQSGLIGEVRHVEAFTDRPIWPQGLNTPKEEMAVPDTMNWDLFVGPARMRPYHEIYTPWNFRGWWDFGTGALGDMACHILDGLYRALEPGYPTRVQGSSSMLLLDSAPVSQRVQLIFPERETQKMGRQPELKVDWYDGGLQPLKPEGWPAGRSMNHLGGGLLFHGSEDTLIAGCYGRDPWLLSGRVPEGVSQTERRVETNHYMDFVRACKESPDSRVPCKSDFAFAGPFNEMVVMGVLAVRLQALNKELHWDGPNMRFTNISENEELRIIIEDGFEITDGHPSFRRTMTDPLNARDFAENLIRTPYREGWDLPSMPA
ncbi:Oxidoreductase family, NAD-binding Rossmann fold [Cyclonatronum proteinivorum]|uniref:Oxidoreductase family, NAD-binding Rossmann fold n=1 Tax=Cyclonatronum proteinivorum TaxID=1457365 RepID=A0A345UNN4_9BACT|nr:Gfo/Idh/MocA family oxidoreductase [Cyclonatronum proteinivorum]AXJ02086.1 Oxidoreductase family, NAD-binding Rossmann fold [Cyclonatronum proteinivorum]